MTISGRAALLAAARAELAEHGEAGIGLRAVARRAGVSHAAPKYHFADRAGLLTAVAAEGFTALADALDGVVLDAPGVGPRERLAALGRAYVDFGLVHPALFDLMFRAGELHADDPELRAARSAAISGLRAAVGDLATGERAPSTPTLVSWAFVHGLVALVRGGALQSAAGVDPDAGADLTHRLTDVFAAAFAERATPDVAPG